MNDLDDCGKAQGDGKDRRRRTKSTTTTSSYVNDFLFGGMTGENGQFICPEAQSISSALPTESTECSFAPKQDSCDDLKDVTELTMIWSGESGVNVYTPLGQTFLNVTKGQVVKFAANTAVMGNDFEIYLNGTVTGTSRFHLSCSDDKMNGPEDCGELQGDGKQRRRRAKDTKGTTAPALPFDQ